VIFFIYIESVIGQPTDMGRKLCTGANLSAVLDFMKAGTCVSVSVTFQSFDLHLCSAVLVYFFNARGRVGGVGCRLGCLRTPLSVFQFLTFLVYDIGKY
jgi:hypothetical protein